MNLEKCEVICVEDYETPSDYKIVANNAELMTGIEQLVQTWSKQIEQVCIRNILFIVLSSMRSDTTTAH